ncbi:MAG: ferredoxin [Chlorobi bacterium]|nr:ferredoxin [Chlorobiota bacterium]
MPVITLQRNKCIGCNYCVEAAPELFRMSRKDGKAVLLGAYEKKGFHTLRTPLEELYEPARRAAKACPARIIQVKK